MEDHQRKLAKEEEIRRLEKERVRNVVNCGWQWSESTFTTESDLVSKILKKFSVRVKLPHQL